MMMADFLGKPVSNLLQTAPFKHWPIERWVDDDAESPEVGYMFQGCGLQLSCDREHEVVQSIFLEAEEYAGVVLSEISFNESRQQVLARFGPPSKSGGRVSHAILGEFGPWDRFQMSDYTIHVQYDLESDTIAKITLMRNEVVP